jgi:hypothetical protein
MNVNRTCQYCNIDHGSLQEVRFYDYHALRGTVQHKYPILSGGLLNVRLMCGQESCLKKAMNERKAELLEERNS